MSQSDPQQSVVVYLVKHHPLEQPEEGQFFRWLHFDNDFHHQLKGMLGPYDPQKLTLLVDDQPAGEAWHLLLENLIQERIRYVVTHFAPLSPAQRQQLIGVCAEVGTHLITPSDAGRNREDDLEHKI